MKLIILDRDGVINKDSNAYIKMPVEWAPLPKSLEAIARLNQAGYKIVVITNQSAVGRGYCSLETLKEIHGKMETMLAQHSGKIAKIYFCPHTPEDNCNCRKPKTGMFAQVAADYNIDLHDVINIGDSLRDMQAGTAIGCTNYLVKTGNGLQTLSTLEKNSATENQVKNIKAFADLADATDYILRFS